ncbi:MAG: adenylosuccinate synthase [bacterium]
MGVTALLGLQWGDEGKGKVVDALCDHHDIVVRCQGGANAGHTVVIGADKYVFHMIPSGILHEGIVCVVGSGVVVDLDVLAQEINQLVEKGIPVIGRLMVSKKAHVVLPFHKEIDAWHESSRGKTKIGTTGRGIGPSYSDKYLRIGVRIGDLQDDSTLSRRLRVLSDIYGLGSGLNAKPDYDEMISFLSRFKNLVKEIAFDTEGFVLGQMQKGKMVLLEGSQGFMLDIDHGTYPYVTSCSTGVGGLCAGSGIPPSSIDKTIGVVKSYVTRVGEGPMPSEMEEPTQSLVRQKGNEFGATTGRPRRCGWLDLVALRYASHINGVTSIVLTKLDTISGIEQIRICKAYECDGMLIKEFPSEADFLYRCKPVYEVVKGWRELSGIDSIEDLPKEALEYISLIKSTTGCSIEAISIGPSREQMIRS